MSHDKINYIVALLYFIMPFYFKSNLGFALPYLLMPFIILIIYKELLKPNFMTGFLLFYTILLILQNIFIYGIDFEFFIRKYLSIISFIILFYSSGLFYNKKYDKYIIYSFILVFIYGLYSSFSYIFSYEEFLIPGTCESNNLSPFNHLRCSTFGEGNYYGNYISLIAILYSDNRKISFLSFISSLVSFSPVAIVITYYILFKKYNKFIIFSILSAIIFMFINIDNIILALKSETSSFGERLEFFRAAFEMGFKNIFIGVGMGQYGVNLEKYTDFSHFIIASLSSARYIPNNNLAELFSEQGLFGLFFYFMYLRRFSLGKIGSLSNQSVIYFIIIIGLAMPTLYLSFVAVLSGAIFAKLKISSQSALSNKCS